ncbi:hypothetical protein MiSe_02260 [Microseira wollei NIES-4236]|uniref:Transposase n=1 Tax=Microseira wollei NIES-4236 TaxID=2530354 RepID=A0AAV3WED0_9CYAN|nr:hypothetical protein MiSe_02260 [Microseira wollei NIES-4236]
MQSVETEFLLASGLLVALSGELVLLNRKDAKDTKEERGRSQKKSEEVRRSNKITETRFLGRFLPRATTKVLALEECGSRFPPSLCA